MKELAVKEKFVELRAQGKSFAAISATLDVSKPILITWSRETKEDVYNMRQINAEVIREKYRMGAERRMELFSKQLDAVEGELGKRDLSQVPTERLFDLMTKLSRELNLADTPVTFQKRSNPLELDLGDLAPVTWQA